MRTRRFELNADDRRFAFSLDKKPGETTASLHRRKGDIMRKAGIHVYTHNFDFDPGRNCMICWFGVNIFTNIEIVTDTGKISGLICEKCAIRISEVLDSAIEKRQARIERHGKDL